MHLTEKREQRNSYIHYTYHTYRGKGIARSLRNIYERNNDNVTIGLRDILS